MMFDATINIGTIIQTIGIVGSVAFFVWKMHARLLVMDVKLTAVVEHNDRIDIELHKLRDVVITLAQQGERLNHFEKRIAALENKRSRQ